MISRYLEAAFNSVLEVPELYSLADPATWERLFAGNDSDAGVRVNHSVALSLAPVFQAVATISGDLAAMPISILKENQATGFHEIDYSNPSQPIVSTAWNDETSAFEGWRRLYAHAGLWGNGYAFIDRNGRFGPAKAMYNLLPDRTAPARTASGELFYVTETDGEIEPLFKEEIFHLKGFSIENARGLDLVHKARNSIGLALAAEGYSSKFFANGAHTGGVLVIPSSWKEPAVQRLEEGFRQRSQKNNWFKTAILRDGAKFEATSVDAEKAQLHELREDQVRDVGRYFLMPPFKLGIADSMSYNSSEMAQMVYYITPLTHWTSATEGEIRMKLIDPKARFDGSHRVHWDATKLLALDAKSKAGVQEIKRRNLIINANEWRREDGMNPRKDPGGEEYVNPNVKSANDTGDGTGESDPPAPTEPQPSPKPKKPAGGMVVESPRTIPGKSEIRNALADAVARVARRVGHDARTAAVKPTKFAAWLDAGAIDHHKVFDQSLRPILDIQQAVCDVNADESAMHLKGMFFGELLASLKPLIEPPHKANELAANVAAACESFENTIADQLFRDAA